MSLMRKSCILSVSIIVNPIIIEYGERTMNDEARRWETKNGREREREYTCQVSGCSLCYGFNGGLVCSLHLKMLFPIGGIVIWNAPSYSGYLVLGKQTYQKKRYFFNSRRRDVFVEKRYRTDRIGIIKQKRERKKTKNFMSTM